MFELYTLLLTKNSTGMSFRAGFERFMGLLNILQAESDKLLLSEYAKMLFGFHENSLLLFHRMKLLYPRVFFVYISPG